MSTLTLPTKSISFEPESTKRHNSGPLFEAPDMNRSDLIHSMAARLPEIPNHDVDQATRLLFELMSSNLARGDRLEIRGFGVLSIHTRKPSTRRNPKNGEPVSIPAKSVVHFKPGKLLKERVTSSRAHTSIQE